MNEHDVSLSQFAVFVGIFKHIYILRATIKLSRVAELSLALDPACVIGAGYTKAFAISKDSNCLNLR